MIKELIQEAEMIVQIYGHNTLASTFAQKIINQDIDLQKVKIYSTVLDYLDEHFAAPFYVKTNKYEIGTILYTANPYIRTNATIIGIEQSIGTFYTVLTDIGNVMKVNAKTLELEYLPPVCKRTATVPENIEDYYKPPSTHKLDNYPRV